MSAGKPTPGPWAVSDDAGQAVVSLGDVPVRDIVVATLPRIHHANARLIAAAPELLEALQNLVEIGKRDLSNPKYDGYFEAAKTAIEKATIPNT